MPFLAVWKAKKLATFFAIYDFFLDELFMSFDWFEKPNLEKCQSRLLWFLSYGCCCMTRLLF